MRSVPKSGIPDAHRVVEASRAAWWRIDRYDLYWLIALTLIAGILRFASPIFLDVFAHPGSSAPISAWGLGHNYQDPSLPGLGKANDIAPNSPFVFDELYFANDAHNDLLGRDYFDPEPPLAKLIIALTGVTLGLALGAKWTTLAAYGTIVVILALRLILRWTRYDSATGGVVLLSLAILPAIFYGLSFIRYLTITHGITNLPQPA